MGKEDGSVQPWKRARECQDQTASNGFGMFRRLACIRAREEDLISVSWLAALVAMPPLASPHRDILHPEMGQSGESGRDWVRVRPVDRPSKLVSILGQHIRKLLQPMGGPTGTQDLVVRSLTRSLDVLLEEHVLVPFDSERHARSSTPLDLGAAATESKGSCPKGPCLLYLLTSPSSYGLLHRHTWSNSRHSAWESVGILACMLQACLQTLVSSPAHVDVAY